MNILQFLGGAVDISSFPEKHDGPTPTTIATVCPDCSKAVASGDHSDAECARCGLETTKCVMWDDLCIECQLLVDDAKLDAGRL